VLDPTGSIFEVWKKVFDTEALEVSMKDKMFLMDLKNAVRMGKKLLVKDVEEIDSII